jgi:hypothetical protein
MWVLEKEGPYKTQRKMTFRGRLQYIHGHDNL